jgi:tRNA1(Val) A37 N6-methylase TrmN6
MRGAFLKKGEGTMRLAGRIKMGYYPTPLSIVERIKSFVSIPKNQPINALDPCCGEGLALRNLTEGLDCETYGIELDSHRAEEAKENLHHVLKCSYTEARITNGCYSLLFLNPPYDEETLNDGTVTSSERKEKVFLKDTIKYLQPGGVLIYIIPQPRLDTSIAKILSYRFEQLSIYRFHGEEYDAFKQIVLFAVKRKEPGIGEEDLLALSKVKDSKLPETPLLTEPCYSLPQARKVTLFRSSVIDKDELEKEAKSSPLWRKLSEMARCDELRRERPPLPLHQGHIALMLANGCLDGVVGEGDDRHVVKGRVQKVVATYQEQNEDGYQEREIDRYQVSVKILTLDGEIRVLV